MTLEEKLERARRELKKLSDTGNPNDPKVVKKMHNYLAEIDRLNEAIRKH